MEKSTPFWRSAEDVKTVVTVGVLTIGFAVWELVRRLVDVVPNQDVPVEIAPEERAAQLPLGPGGEPVDVNAEKVLVTVSDLAPAAYIGVLGTSVVGPLVVIAVTLLGIGLCRALLRGEVFIPANTRRVSLIAVTVIAGAVLSDGFATLQHNGVLAALAAPGEPTGTDQRFEYLPFVVGLAFVVFARAFHVGEKLQRDTEGLV